MVDIIPGLKGFGTDTRAAYGTTNPPEICIVDELGTATGPPSWDPAYGANNIGVFKGTLIQCLEGVDTLGGETIDGHVVLPNSGKIVLFETSGTISEGGPADQDDRFRYKIGSYTTIAGQTSPNPGILLRNICVYGGGVHDILVQHLRGRMDGPPSTNYNLHKSFSFPSGGASQPAYNIVVDHISAAWGADGNITFYKAAGELHDITLSNCIMAEAREATGVTDTNGDIGKNCLFGGSDYAAVPTNLLVYNNLIMNTRKRNPKAQHSEIAIVNNYLYNNRDSGVGFVAETGPGKLSLVGNVVDAGPMSIGTTTINDILYLGWPQWELPVSQNEVYLYDNKTEAGTQTSSNDWDMSNYVYANNNNSNAINGYLDFKVTGETPSTDAPLWPTDLTLIASSAVKDYIIANAGAYPAFRDSLDLRFIDEMTNGTGPSSVVTGSPASGDWPVLDVNSSTLNIPANPHVDSGDGYTNLEVWLHGLAADVEGENAPYTRFRGINKPKPRFNQIGGRFR